MLNNYKQFYGYLNSVKIWQINVAVLTIVITFVLWQFYTIFVKNKSKKSNLPINKSIASLPNLKKESVDRKVGDDIDIVNEDDDFFNYLKVAEIRYRGLEFSENEMQMRSQIFYETMKIRRSVRCFSSKPVSLKIMQNLIKTAGSAPSGANLQPWTFCLIKNDAIKRSIREIVEYEEQINYSRRMGAKWVLDVKDLNVCWNKPYLTEAPYLIVVLKHCYQLKNGLKQPTYYSEISCSIAVGFFLAAIQYAGLVTVTTTPLNAGTAIRNLLQRPSNEKVLVLLPVGYPAPDVHVPNIERKVLEDIVRIY